MTHRKLLMASAIIASAAITACSDTTGPKPLASGDLSSASAPSSGELHVTKDCSKYTGHAGDFCTITSSNLWAIKVGSRIVYASDAVGTRLDTDIRIVPPLRGQNRAFGHCTLNLRTGVGRCRISRGTGNLRGFQARVAVSYRGGPNYAWDGTYSFDRDN
jgi:hypothetical protein